MKLSSYYNAFQDCVVVVPDGDVTTENIQASSKAALQLASKHKCKLLLFDIRNCKESQSILQGFLDMRDMTTTTGISKEFACAILYNPALYPAERAAFIESLVTVGPNPLFRLFQLESEANKWLSLIRSNRLKT